MTLDGVTLIGLIAATGTTVSYVPQLKKCWVTGNAGDLSLKMLCTLAFGVAMWVVYGVLKQDAVIILANAISLCLLAGILFFKLRVTPAVNAPAAACAVPPGRNQTWPTRFERDGS